MTKSKTYLLSLLMLIQLLTLCVPASLLSQTGDRESIIEGAKKEQRLVIYSVLQLPDHLQIVKRFQEKYPFIDVDVSRPSTEKMVNRIVTEARVGKHLVDVIGLNDVLMTHLVKQGLLGKYTSPEIRHFEAGLYNEEGFWSPFYINPYVIPYNTKAVGREEAPRDYPDLLNPRWKGKLVMDEREIEWFATMVKYWGEKNGLGYMRRLAEQNLQRGSGATLLAQLVAAGEYAAAVVLHGPRVESLKVKSAPIDWNAPNPTVISIVTMGIAARAPHPNAARLYIDHVLSQEIQEEFLGNKFLKPSARKGINSPFMEKLHRANVKMIPMFTGVGEDWKKYENQYREVFEK
jgi:iron(III) transport system substrate-binding protein